MHGCTLTARKKSTHVGGKKSPLSRARGALAPDEGINGLCEDTCAGRVCAADGQSSLLRGNSPTQAGMVDRPVRPRVRRARGRARVRARAPALAEKVCWPPGQGGCLPALGWAAAHPRLVGSPEGGSRPNARAAASGLLVEAGRQFSRYTQVFNKYALRVFSSLSLRHTAAFSRARQRATPTRLPLRPSIRLLCFASHAEASAHSTNHARSQQRAGTNFVKT